MIKHEKYLRMYNLKNEEKMKHTIKLTAIVLMAFITLTFSGCSNASKIDLANNQAQKQEVFNQISQNQTLFNDFMLQMMENPQNMHWMMQNEAMMQHMFQQNNLQYMMQHNSEMNTYMMQNMMNMIGSDSTYYHQWNQMMNHSGMRGGMGMMRPE